MNMNNLARTHEILTPQLATKVGLTKFEFYKYLQQSNNHGNLKCSPKEIFLINITQSKETFVNTVHCQSTDENHSFSLL